MTTAIKFINSVLLQTLACILGFFSSLFSVPSVLASYAPRLLLDAVSFLGTWLTGHLHLGGADSSSSATQAIRFSGTEIDTAVCF